MEMSATLQSCPRPAFPLPQQLQHHLCRSKRLNLRPFPRPRRTDFALLSKYGRWDSNAEEMGRSKRFGFDYPDEDDDPRSRKKERRWWSGDPRDEEVEDEEEEMGIVEEVIDSIWILKVFRSYGWTLPAILVSLLLATGPQAFLTAMAFPLAQSALTLAYNRISGRKGSRSRVHAMKRMRKRTRKKPSNAASNMGKKWNPRNRNSSASEKWVDDEIFSSNGAASFGGWEELDGAQPRTAAFDRSSKAEEAASRKLSGGQRSAPLLLRLLVAMFPFLGLWIDMFR
ncbi:hypothetical protein SAY87_023911 [Trapa incisa]|uniref:Uncharacterized protein n=1 Tax=Trapa incisa TaxID=236973 RepID=A0AAN7KZN5_9MYRT|nr:hypothetical protein SAY87_023911 [Trapa incisa]